MADLGGTSAFKRKRRGRLREFLSPDSELRSSTWDAPPPRFHTITTRDEVPERIEPQIGEAWLVPDFELAETVIERGADSARVAVARGMDSQSWLEALALSGPEEPLVPPRPFEFPWGLLVILPTYNESESLESVLCAIRRYLVCDVLVVDDNSPDGTGELAEQLASKDERLDVLRRPGKAGLGKAYLAGFDWGLRRGFERLFEMDCDFSHPPWDLPRLAAASGGSDLVIGSRYVPGGSTTGWTFRRRLLSKGGNLYTRFFLGRGVRDWTSGFRCYRRELLESLDLARVAANGYSFQIEMTWHSRRKGANIRELPIRFTDRSLGKSKMGLPIAFEALRVVPRLRLRG